MTEDTLQHDRPPTAEEAKADWEQRIYTRITDTSEADPSTDLPAPRDVRAEPGAGHVRLSWTSVEGAAGYVIERTAPGAEPQIVRHGGSDVPAVVGPEFADTNLDDGVVYSYRLGAVTGGDHPAWNWSEPVTGTTSGAAAGPVSVSVDASRVTGRLDRVWRMLGSERLTQLRFGDDQHNGHPIGAEFATALQIAHDDLGLRRIRAHAILHDDNHVVSRADDGSLAFDFTVVDELYDRLLAMDVRPVVEVGFMPAVLARDPQETVFAYHGIISPPSSWEEWGQVNAALAAHLVDRYGLDEVADWGFEIWNEPNLEVFWAGTQQEYLRLYAEAARAIKGVDERLLVGGPGSSAGEWVDVLARHAEQEGLPLDFLSSHTYGNLPLDNTATLAEHGFGEVPIWWTEWGVGSTHFGPIHDSVLGCAFVLAGLKSVQGRMAALAYWVVSDHFEELGRPPRLFHDGFGLLSVGNLRKPRYWGVHLAEHLGDDVLDTSVSGDGAGVLVDAWATRHDDGTVDVLVWNGVINGELVDGDPRLDRTVRVRVDGLDDGTYAAEVARVDQEHSNIVRWAPKDVDWPDEEQFAELRTHDRLHTEPGTDVRGRLDLEVALPMPGVVRLRLSPRTGGAP